MSENVTMVDKISDVHASKVHADLDTGIGPRAAPKRNLYHIEILPLVHGYWLLVALRKHQELDLVHVEFVIFHGLVLNAPVFHSTLVGDDGWWIERVEQRRGRAVNGDKEVCWTGRIGGIRQHFREEQGALRGRLRGGKPSESLRIGGPRWLRDDRQLWDRRVAELDRGQRARWIVVPIRAGIDVQGNKGRSYAGRRRADDELRARRGCYEKMSVWVESVPCPVPS
jgi:hypothetical protein